MLTIGAVLLWWSTDGRVKLPWWTWVCIVLDTALSNLPTMLVGRILWRAVV